MDQVISELCYKGKILQRIYRKMTILWLFPIFPLNSYRVEGFGSHNLTVLYPNPCYDKMCYKGTALYCYKVLDNSSPSIDHCILLYNSTVQEQYLLVPCSSIT